MKLINFRKGIDKDIKNVTKPTLEASIWKTVNGWHKQTHNLDKISYLHYGKPRVWYSVPPCEESEFFMHACREIPAPFKRCSESL